MYETLAGVAGCVIGQCVDAIVIFRCGDVRCALDRAAVSEIAPVTDFSVPPSTPPILAGFLNLGGELVGVADAERLFQTTPGADVDPLYRHVLILRETSAGGARLGLLVDRVEDVRRADRLTVRASQPGDTLNGCVVGEIDTPAGSAHLLAPGRILLAAERERIDGLRAAEQARLDAAGAA